MDVEKGRGLTEDDDLPHLLRDEDPLVAGVGQRERLVETSRDRPENDGRLGDGGRGRKEDDEDSNDEEPHAASIMQRTGLILE